MTKEIRRSHHPVGVRIQALALMTHGVDIRLVEQVTGMPRQTIQFWVRKARERGYNPYVDSRIRIEYVEDGKRSGRPRTSRSTGLSVLELVEQNRAQGGV
ncbi:hypothetical protein ASPWEDRAFT_34940 [Aspergillus wentii DTO 134E9]|uniref:Uncharacterized protein n=1 Tax=Aspergillus wentii DTO 134E9 TaxID=1073089 RepID=A0A1L9S2L5_ASPWE|nr:uncharacterized protein ASPWEDRAFT_34940 [Aspergillus wentii DTO 134E9]OJJ41393.1 hypothetical protein ASPWEDRAFT_34940 [Aspergillus wentii DTO 134E9]